MEFDLLEKPAKEHGFLSCLHSSLFTGDFAELALYTAGAVHGTAWELEKVRGNVTLAMLTLAVISVIASLGVFGKDRLVLCREASSGTPLMLGLVVIPAVTSQRSLSLSLEAKCISSHILCSPITLLMSIF